MLQQQDRVQPSLSLQDVDACCETKWLMVSWKSRQRIAECRSVQESGTHRAQVIVCPVVSNPPVKKTPISAAIRSSGRGRPAHGMHVTLHCVGAIAKLQTRASQSCRDYQCPWNGCRLTGGR